VIAEPRPYDRELGGVAPSLHRHRSAAVERRHQRRGAAPASCSLTLSAHRAAALRTTRDQIYFQVLGARRRRLSRRATPSCPAPDSSARPCHAGEALVRDDFARDEAVRVACAVAAAARAGGRASGDWCRWPRRWASARGLAAEIIKGVMLPQFVILPHGRAAGVAGAGARHPAAGRDLQQRIREPRRHGDLSPHRRARRAARRSRRWCDAINDLLQRLDQLDRRRSEHFLADAAHQLKTPLAGAAHAGRAGRRARSTPAARPGRR
jgi:two-component system sensor histidine kinase TctE